MCFSYALEWQSGQRIYRTTAEPSEHAVVGAYSTKTIPLPPPNDRGYTLGRVVVDLSEMCKSLSLAPAPGGTCPHSDSGAQPSYRSTAYLFTDQSTHTLTCVGSHLIGRKLV